MPTVAARAARAAGAVFLGFAGMAVLASCASRRAARSFAPASPESVQRALGAWTAARERAASLPPARLLYDARMGSRGVAVIPGTLAVSYDGNRVERASLTGPFGSAIAEYAHGEVTGEDRRAMFVDPETLRSVLAGTWPGDPAAVAGCDGSDCLLLWRGGVEAAAVIDAETGRVRSLRITGREGNLEVTYDGEADPWPQRLAMREEKSGRSLRLLRIAVEPAAVPSPEPSEP